MNSLKETKEKINSIRTAKKITSTMRMVSSAKLYVAQNQIEKFSPYQQLKNMMSNFLPSETDYTSPLSMKRDVVNAVAIVVISSNSGLCGAFNSNIIKLLNQTIKDYSHIAQEKIYIYPIGEKVENAVKKAKRTIQGSFIHLIAKPKFNEVENIADNLIADFLNKKIDKVELLYNQFKSTASQISTREQFLPVPLIPQQSTKTILTDYIIEPDKITIFEELMRESLKIQLYAGVLNSAASEQAARTIAMHKATENAKEFLSKLTIQYNTQRQQAITSELLDIVGGAEVLRKYAPI